jgi:hypothetical protein
MRFGRSVAVAAWPLRFSRKSAHSLGFAISMREYGGHSTDLAVLGDLVRIR